MAPNSPIFLDVDFDDAPPTTTQRRHRSNEDLDFLKEQDRWRRHEEARQMVRYRDKNHFGATTQQRTPRDHLAVPVYEVSPRRPRAKSDTRPSAQEVENLQRDFRTLEVRPSSRLFDSADDGDDEEMRRARWEKQERGSTQSRDPDFPGQKEKDRPKIKIPPVIIQEHPPEGRPGGRRPGSRSSSGQPQLQVKYLTLQNKLSDIALVCIRYIDVEAANPRDLTFEKISEQVKGFAFELRVWHHISNVEEMPRSSKQGPSEGVIDAAARNLDRLIERATELCEVCDEAEPGDLKFKDVEKLGDGDEENIFSSSDDTQEAGNDPTESKGFIISSSLRSIKLQIQHLKRLSRPLQDATPAAQEEVAAVSSLVHDVDRYFGSEEALRRNGVDKKYSGRRALQEAKYAAAR